MRLLALMPSGALRLALLLLMVSASAFAQDSEEAALVLADRTATEPAARRACIEYAEGAAIGTTYSDDDPMSTGGRGSLDVRCDGAIADGWRAVLSDRFDEFAARGSAARAVNTLKEAYVSIQSGGSFLLDLGRINVREGAGFAYNPTDYFRADAVRAVISIAPETVREERMGTVMGRLQTLWSSGSLTGMFAPHLASGSSDSTFSPDLGATNEASRWLVILSQRLTSELQPQISVTGARHESARVGLNLTYLINHATVVYVEWSGSRVPGNLSRSGYDRSIQETSTFHHQIAAGITYTTSTKLSVTVEYEYDGAAPDQMQWEVIRRTPTPAYVRYREYAGMHGELATRQNLFTYAHWDDVGVDGLGLTAFTRFDPYDHSRVSWMEARYHWEHAGVALQWQRNAGDASSDLAPWPVRQSWLALVDYYF